MAVNGKNKTRIWSYKFIALHLRQEFISKTTEKYTICPVQNVQASDN